MKNNYSASKLSYINKDLIFNNIISTLLSFLLNIYIFNHYNNNNNDEYNNIKLLGISQIECLLFYTLSTTLCRETMRKISIKYSMSKKLKDTKNDEIIFFTWFFNYFGLFILLPIISLIFFNYPSKKIIDDNNNNNNIKIEDYQLSIIIILIGTIFEIFSEPLFIYSQILHYHKLKSTIEIISIITKYITIFILIFFFDFLIIISFSIGCFVYSFTIFFSYFIYYFIFFDKNDLIKIIKPPPISEIINIEKKFIDLIKITYINELCNLFSFEGGNILIMLFNKDLTNQGVYSMIFSLFSLIIKPLLFFIDEIISFTISNKLYKISSSSIIQNNEDNNDILISKQIFISSLIKITTWISLLFILIIPRYTYIMVFFLNNALPLLKKDNIFKTLSSYSIYIGFFIFNNIIESFLKRILKKRDMQDFNERSIVCFIISCILYVSIRSVFGIYTIIITNSLTIFIRIYFNIYIVKQYITNSWMSSMNIYFPYILSFIITKITEFYIYKIGHFFHIFFGIFIFLFIIKAIYTNENRLLHNIYEKILLPFFSSPISEGKRKKKGA